MNTVDREQLAIAAGELELATTMLLEWRPTPDGFEDFVAATAGYAAAVAEFLKALAVKETPDDVFRRHLHEAVDVVYDAPEDAAPEADAAFSTLLRIAHARRRRPYERPTLTELDASDARVRSVLEEVHSRMQDQVK
jgi:hypothetical protein